MDSIIVGRRARRSWSDDRLTADLERAAANERAALVDLLLDLAEFDKRSLGERGGYSSLFDYCRRRLGCSEPEAGRKVAVARKGDEFPLLLRMLERGELHLSGAGALAPVLTSENRRRVLKRARRKSQREVERIVAALAPKPVPRDTIRALRAPAEAAGALAAPASPSAALCTGPARGAAQATAPAGAADLFGAPVEQPPAQAEPELYEIRFVATRETRKLLDRAQALLRHRFPRGETDAIINLALKRLLRDVDRDLRKPPGRARAGLARPRIEAVRPSRYIPEAVKQEAWERDGGQCSFVAADGTRCAARAWLEFDHELPFARGGASDQAGNIRPMCRPHNQWLRRQAFGDRPGERRRRRRTPGGLPGARPEERRGSPGGRPGGGSGEDEGSAEGRGDSPTGA